MSLFRRETEDARANAWLGAVLLTRPLSFSVLTGASLLIVAAMAAYFIGGEYTRKARVMGVLVPVNGVVRIVATQAGVVQALHVHEGMQLEPDALIATISDLRLARGEAIGASVAASFHEQRLALVTQRGHALDALRSDQASLSRRSAAFDREQQLLSNELASQSLRINLARQALERALGLESTGFVSAAALDRERDAVLEQESRYDALRRARASLAREAEAIEHEAQAAYARSRAQIAAIDMQLAALEQQRSERQLQYRATIVAPASGVVATVLVEAGQAVTAGMTVATLIPVDAHLEAHLFAPSRSIGFVRSGQEVLLRFLAYPHQKFGGQSARITTIAPNALSPADLGIVPADGSREPLYRIKAALPAQSITAYGKPEPLQPGMQVEADIRLDRRRLIEWIFEPLLSLAGRA
jgi:membrane fusion protein